MVQSFHSAVADVRRHGDLYFAALLSEDRIKKAFGKARWLWQGWIYTPAVTVWVFLSQCLSADHSCREAVARLVAWRVARGLKPCSANTGAYCTARSDLPEAAVRELMHDTGKQVEDEAPPSWLWHGRKVRIVDGSTVTMPDTPENQATYPQQQSQKPGCGFPIARILVIFSLSVGTVLEAAIEKYFT
jgi:putative transposase